MTSTEKKLGYKWIAEYRESLDPSTDYEEIWKLSTCYYVNDFMMNFLYTTGFPHFILPPHGGEVMYRGGAGKAVKNGNRRETDTADHFWRWFEFGPSDLKTQQSVKQVNSIHQGIAKRYPGRYTMLEDFTYTMCWIGADMHRLRIRVGLSGYTEKQQIATHLYWQEIAKLFRGENPGQDPSVSPPAFDAPITDFPTSFDGMLEYMERYEAIDYPFTEAGAATCEVILDQFAEKWFPKGTRFLGRKMILSLLDEAPHRVHRLPYPSALTRWTMEKGLAAVMFAQERILPDPKITTPEKHRRAKKRELAAV